MPGSVIAAQLYTVREFTRTPTDIRSTLKKLGKMGYEAVQVSALGPIAPVELKEIADGEGLEIAATHVGYDEIRRHPQKVIEEHKLWGCRQRGHREPAAEIPERGGLRPVCAERRPRPCVH